MAQNFPEKNKNLIFKSHSNKIQALLAILGWFQEKTFSFNFEPYYLAICEIKVLEIFHSYSKCLSLTFCHLDFKFNNFLIPQGIIKK